MYVPWLDGASGQLLSLEPVPMQIRRVRLVRPAPQDAAWLHQALRRESAEPGTVIARRADDRLLIETGGTRPCA